MRCRVRTITAAESARLKKSRMMQAVFMVCVDSAPEVWYNTGEGLSPPVSSSETTDQIND